MKCRNIFCEDHNPAIAQNCQKRSLETWHYPEQCESRNRYNRAIKAKPFRYHFLETWDKEHDKYYGRK